MTTFVIHWADSDGDSHARLLAGNWPDAEQAAKLLVAKYGDIAERDVHMVEVDGFEPLSRIMAEVEDYLADGAEEHEEKVKLRDALTAALTAHLEHLGEP